ncbi:Preprotein translocase subunit YajC [Moraxella catarrhalis]|nr:Preprotein translocase subunit YajC [Moraxella catarrhalis]
MLDLAITAAHASTGAPAGQQSLLMNLLIPVAFFAIFYFLIHSSTIQTQQATQSHG